MAMLRLRCMARGVASVNEIAKAIASLDRGDRLLQRRRAALSRRIAHVIVLLLVVLDVVVISLDGVTISFDCELVTA